MATSVSNGGRPAKTTHRIHPLALPYGPPCERCGVRTRLVCIGPIDGQPAYVLQTFECPRCCHETFLEALLSYLVPAERDHLYEVIGRVGARARRQGVVVRRLRHLGRDTRQAAGLLELLVRSLSALIDYKNLTAYRPVEPQQQTAMATAQGTKALSMR